MISINNCLDTCTVSSFRVTRFFFNQTLGSEPMETLEDIYIGSIETDRGTREQVRFYDTRGLRDGVEFPRHYYTFADGFVLVYSIDNKDSFKRMEALKKDIDRYRDKKEVRTEPSYMFYRIRIYSCDYAKNNIPPPT